MQLPLTPILKNWSGVIFHTTIQRFWEKNIAKAFSKNRKGLIGKSGKTWKFWKTCKMGWFWEKSGKKSGKIKISENSVFAYTDLSSTFTSL